MSLRSMMIKLGKTPPRAVRVVAAQHIKPIDESVLTERQLANRVGPLLPHIAAGHVPIADDKTARAVGRAMEQQWAKESDHAGSA